ncbi:hypothetical protein G443_004358 [Actinoalloteichus cyanogriseus DSM 43889]|uniref:Uncharacterized protein n=1 Tax=Actinoalloteichus caeruleus DSM 43889 TaxID=1120930 RepID=A0ABT1JNI7_ACTCY|nr:hypothetical protein [Actinoalloteichus caeruleus DSM 43889]
MRAQPGAGVVADRLPGCPLRRRRSSARPRPADTASPVPVGTPSGRNHEIHTRGERHAAGTSWLAGAPAARELTSRVAGPVAAPPQDLFPHGPPGGREVRGPSPGPAPPLDPAPWPAPPPCGGPAPSDSVLVGRGPSFDDVRLEPPGAGRSHSAAPYSATTLFPAHPLTPMRIRVSSSIACSPRAGRGQRAHPGQERHRIHRPRSGPRSPGGLILGRIPCPGLGRPRSRCGFSRTRRAVPGCRPAKRREQAAARFAAQVTMSASPSAFRDGRFWI